MIFVLTKASPSVRVTRAETRLMVYRSPRKDAAAASDSYRRYICKSNKDAAAASWLSSDRACMTRTEGISVRVIRIPGHLLRRR
jgi:hypothetical protein